jgi:glycerol-3-phosphate acyltransferase PlsY
MWDLVWIAAAAYLVGSLPTGVWLTRSRGLADPRLAGSGGSGATNVYRLHGSAHAVTVLLLDIGKGVLAVGLAGWWGATGGAGPRSAWLPALATLAVVTGHVFPVLARFRGGKGVAAFLGAGLVLAPVQAALAFALFVVGLLLSRRVSVGSLIGVSVFPLLLAQSGAPQADRLLVATTAVPIIVCHRENLRRLMNGNEPRLF